MAILYTSVSISALTTVGILIYHLLSQVKMISVQKKLKIKGCSVGACVDKWIHRKPREERELDSDNEAASLLPQFLPSEVGFDSDH
jgi:hypothetical protein